MQVSGSNLNNAPRSVAERIKVLALNDAANNSIVDGLDESANIKDGLLQ